MQSYTQKRHLSKSPYLLSTDVKRVRSMRKHNLCVCVLAMRSTKSGVVLIVTWAQRTESGIHSMKWANVIYIENDTESYKRLYHYSICVHLCRCVCIRMVLFTLLQLLSSSIAFLLLSACTFQSLTPSRLLWLFLYLLYPCLSFRISLSPFPPHHTSSICMSTRERERQDRVFIFRSLSLSLSLVSMCYDHSLSPDSLSHLIASRCLMLLEKLATNEEKTHTHGAFVVVWKPHLHDYNK